MTVTPLPRPGQRPNWGDQLNAAIEARPTLATVKDTIATEVDQSVGPLVPPLVSDALYSDPGLRTTAEGAVELAAEGLDIQTRSHAEIVIGLEGRGVSHLATAAVNTAAIRAAITDAEQTGATVVFPPTPAGTWIAIDDSLPITTGGIRVRGAGKHQTRIRQTGWIKPIFDVTAPNVTIEDMWLDQGPYGTNDASQFRGEPRTSYNAGVWVGADNVEVRNLHTTDLVCSVHFASWDVPSDTLRAALTGCAAHNISSHNVVFNLLIVGAAGLEFSHITGHYSAKTSTPPHLLYISEGLAPNTDISGHDCLSWDGEGSFAYQIKGTSGSTFTNLAARNCRAFLHVMLSDDVTFTGLRDLDDPWDAGGATIDIEGENNNITLDGVRVVMSGDGGVVRFSTETTNSTIRNASIESKHTTTGTSASTDVLLNGTNNTAEDVTVHNTGTGLWQAAISAWGGTGHRIIRPKTSGHKFGVQVRGIPNVQVLDYDLDDVTGTIKGIDMSTLATNYKMRPRLGVASSIGTSNVIAMDNGTTGSGGLGTMLGPTITGHMWTSLFGTWRVGIDDHLIYADVGANASTVIELGTPDIDLQAGLRYQFKDSALIVRVTDRTNYLGLRLNHATNALELYQRAAGADTVLASAPVTVVTGRRYELRIVAYGDTVTAFLDGAQAIAHTLTAAENVNTATRHGLQSTASATPAKFDQPVFRTVT